MQMQTNAAAEPASCGITVLVRTSTGSVLVVPRPCNVWACAACRQAKVDELHNRVRERGEQWFASFVQKAEWATKHKALARADASFVRIPISEDRYFVLNSSGGIEPVDDLMEAIAGALALREANAAPGYVTADRRHSSAAWKRSESNATRSVRFAWTRQSPVEVLGAAKQYGLTTGWIGNDIGRLELPSTELDAYGDFVSAAHLRLFPCGEDALNDARAEPPLRGDVQLRNSWDERFNPCGCVPAAS